MGHAVDALGLVGTTVDQVRFDACVDSGGFGLVYKGRHLGLDEVVAIKCLRLASVSIPTEEVKESLVGRFRDETKILYRLSQGNLDIVRCIGSGTATSPVTGEVTPYMVLEWLEGKTLTQDIRERREAGLPGRTIDEVIELLDPAAGALAYAHAQGVVHRDVKPGNLFLAKTRDGGVRMKVLDFGLAKILSDEIGVRPSVQTAVGVHFCSPSYGAPEQFTTNLGGITPATDVYSLVMVMLEMMKGEKIRPASSLAEGLVKVLDPELGSPKASRVGLTLPPAVEELLHRAVAQRSIERPRDVGVFWSALREVVASSRQPRPPANLLATVADKNVAAEMERVRASQAAQALSGTMVMPSPAAAMASQPPPPRPAAGAPPTFAPTQSAYSPPRSPLAASVVGTGTAPVHPPIKPSRAPAPLPPVAQTPRMPSTRPPEVTTAPGTKKKRKQGSGVLPAIVVFFTILVVGGAAVFWLLMKQQGR